ncbi:MAG: hypothetical protein Q8P82_02660, partial [bacterium]|nr:hypothetical protein [bacterium]
IVILLGVILLVAAEDIEINGTDCGYYNFTNGVYDDTGCACLGKLKKDKVIGSGQWMRCRGIKLYYGYE